MINTDINNGNLQALADFYGTSIPTINRWRKDNSKIPKYALIIKEQYNHINILQSDKDMLKDKIYQLNNSIRHYFKASELLKDCIK